MSFHPIVQGWFDEAFREPTEVQRLGWEQIGDRKNVLLAAPTGSGKTLASFLEAIDRLVRHACEGTLESRTYVIYVSPLKALSNDIERNLEGPLHAIRERATTAGVALDTIRTAVRTGDTPAKERQALLRSPPHILITTPESLYILLTAEKSRTVLAQADTVIVDEIHAVAGDKRGAHLALTLERLDLLAGRKLQRIGLSATQKPIEEVANLLVGDGAPCAVIDQGHKRALDLRVEVPDQNLGHVATNEMKEEIYDRITDLVKTHRTTLVFVNTRRFVERVSQGLGERLGRDRVAAHHGSLSRQARFAAEQALKAGEISVMVATASLELGIDIGHVDLVVHLGSARSIASLLQRVGRSGHTRHGVPKGVLFPLTRDDLIQSVAAVRSVFRGALDRLSIPSAPLDILAQQMVATVASQEISVEALWQSVRRAYSFRALPRETFDEVLDMLSEGIATNRGRKSAYIHHDKVHGVLRPRRSARLAAITSGGAIPDMADYDVVLDPGGTTVGKVHEDFAIESMAGDVFLLGNRSWKIRRVETGRVRVEDATGLAPTIPFWIGEAPARTAELSSAVAELREDVERRLDDPENVISFVMEEGHASRAAAEQIHAYVEESVRVLGTVPTQRRIIAERFFDEAGGMQLVLHTPFGGRINRALGFALRKRFCVSFDFELQAAATDDGVVLSLGEHHSFALDGVFAMLRPSRVREDLVQAVLRSPMFGNRWRWNATRSLSLLRSSGGKRVPIHLQRMRADDLMAAVFPGQTACQDNHGGGPIEVPDHPLVRETVDDCLNEAMDLAGFVEILERIERGEVETIAVETPVPSPLSHEILNANPYAFLDDAPLEERRARAVSLRRVDPDSSQGIGALDPRAIAEVRAQAWPDVRNADEVHDALLSLRLYPVREGREGPWHVLLSELQQDGRVLLREAFGNTYFVATERCEDALDDEGLVHVIRGWMDVVGPVTAKSLAERLGLPVLVVEVALARLELGGGVMRGTYTRAAHGEVEWCERGLLARIHRLTLNALRREIEAVSQTDFMRYLFRYQHLAKGTQLHGTAGVLEVIEQLSGIEVPGTAWETSLLPSRVRDYTPLDLDHLCLSGEVAWARLSTADGGLGADGAKKRKLVPTRSAPLAFFPRAEMHALLGAAARPETSVLSPTAERVRAHLQKVGASFTADLVARLELTTAIVEEALWELVTKGLVTGDGVGGLRALIAPERKRAGGPRLRLLGESRRSSVAGRWSLLAPDVSEVSGSSADDVAERTAKRLLRRYGVVFRELCARERHAVPWRALLVVFRRLEARGELRGGHFVSGFVGEQFALPDSVAALRAVRRARKEGEVVTISAADPLNLVGIVVPGSRVAITSTDVLAFRDGELLCAGSLGHVRSKVEAQSA
ncbi:MAG: DEAD/DEAH box helicase [Polyangiaceae bacterium]